MAAETVSLLDVQARWAYSEIIDSAFVDLYDDWPDISTLRTRRHGSVPFEELSSAEQYNLAFMCACARTNLMVFLTGTERFVKLPLNKNQMADLLVPPMVSGTLVDRWSSVPKQMIPFKRFMTVKSPNPHDPKDARNAPDTYHLSAEPLTIGRLHNNLVLLDGYHRAASFWKSAPQNASIAAYVPTVLLHSGQE